MFRFIELFGNFQYTCQAILSGLFSLFSPEIKLSLLYCRIISEKEKKLFQNFSKTNMIETKKKDTIV